MGSMGGVVAHACSEEPVSSSIEEIVTSSLHMVPGVVMQSCIAMWGALASSNLARIYIATWRQVRVSRHFGSMGYSSPLRCRCRASRIPSVFIILSTVGVASPLCDHLHTHW